MMRLRRSAYPSARGLALTVVLGLVAVLTFWSMTTVATTPAATRIAENDRQIAQYYMTGAQALYAAEAGLEEARARLRTSAGLHRIADNAPDDPTWGVSMRTKGEMQAPGSSLATHERVASLQHDLTYTVTIRHATHPPTAAVLRWGDERGEGINTRNTTRGEVIYVITAHGEQGEARRTVEIEATPEPPPTVPAALYVAGPIRMQGGHTHISGIDSCGDQHQAGVRTTLPPSPMASMPGTMPPMPQSMIIGVPPIAYQSVSLHVQAIVDTLKERATVVYAPTPTEAASASPGEHWGLPKLGANPEAPSTCAERHIVHYNTHGTQGRLRPGTSGCGVLLIEGDVEIQGDFTWYGAILVTGSLRLAGAGSKQVTGGMVVAGAVTSENDGETNLVYCSEAIAAPTRYLPLRILTWRDVHPAMH